MTDRTNRGVAAGCIVLGAFTAVGYALGFLMAVALGAWR